MSSDSDRCECVSWLISRSMRSWRSIIPVASDSDRPARVNQSRAFMTSCARVTRVLAQCGGFWRENVISAPPRSKQHEQNH